MLSRRHAEFSGEKEATVRDLGSRNGILVNGVKTRQAVLRAGDVVQVGQLQVKFVDELGPFMDVWRTGVELAGPYGVARNFSSAISRL